MTAELTRYRAALLASDQTWRAYLRAVMHGDRAEVARLERERGVLSVRLREAHTALDRAILAEAKAEAEAAP